LSLIISDYVIVSLLTKILTTFCLSQIFFLLPNKQPFIVKWNVSVILQLFLFTWHGLYVV